VLNLLLLASGEARASNQNIRGTSSSAQTSTPESVTIVSFTHALAFAVDFFDCLICRLLSLLIHKRKITGLYIFISQTIDEIRHFSHGSPTINYNQRF